MNANFLSRKGYQQTAGGEIEAKPHRPKTLAEAKFLIEQTFERNRWDERSKEIYMKSKGVQPKEVSDLSVDETRVLIAALVASRMLLLNEGPK